MSILIRRVTRSGGGVERKDIVVTTDAITIGRATDQTLHIPDGRLALSHSVIRDAGSFLQVKANAGCFLFVNEERTTSARLKPGDLLEISSYRILVGDPPAGHDHFLLVEAGDVDEVETNPREEFRTNLDNTWMRKRWVSWTLVASLIVLGLVLPSLSMMNKSLDETMASLVVVPTDDVWESGPLHPSHQFIGNDCGACHAKPFQRTQDAQCISCHSFVEHHVDVSAHEVPELDGTRCASCHREHLEPQALVRRDQGICADCHQDLDAVTPGTSDLQDATDFYDNHPEFRVSLVVPEGRGNSTSWTIDRVALNDQALEEKSNLKFPHDVHVDLGGVDSPTGSRVMECKECHRLESGGAYIEPVTMELHCAECHRLTFDRNDPEREVPHGDAPAVLTMLEEYYSRLYLETGGVSKATQTQDRGDRRRRRTSGSGGAATDVPPAGDRKAAYEWAQRRAELAAQDVFEQRTCMICHDISKDDTAPPAQRWEVDPVHLARVWMPKSLFDHEAHLTYECSYCHAAQASEESSDVLMPGIGICRDCHGGEHATDLLASSCTECHQFHIPGLEVMKPWVAGAIDREEAARTLQIRESRSSLVLEDGSAMGGQ